MNLHHFQYFDPTKKSAKINSFSSIPYWLRFIKKSAHAHNVFFGLGFWASLERRVDEIKNSKVKSFYNYLTHYLLAITEFSIFWDTNPRLSGKCSRIDDFLTSPL